MRVHHLDCGTMCPPGGRLVDGRGSPFSSARLVCHCLLVECESCLVLVDTGLGATGDGGAARASGFFALELRPQLGPAGTACMQVEQLGYSRRDVRHIVLTHLDFDHAGGLADFPEAQLHVSEDELAAAAAPRGFLARQRYGLVPRGAGLRWKTYSLQGHRWHGFEAVRDLEGLPPEILLVPLAGHTAGHCGVAVRPASGRWLLHAGDAYFYRDELKDRPYCTPALRLYQRQMEVARESRLYNQERLRDLAARAPGIVDIFCAHDVVEFEQRAAPPRGRGDRGRSSRTPGYTRSAG